MAMAKLFTYISYKAPGTILGLGHVDTKVLLVWRKGCQKEATKETGSQSERWLGLNLGATFSEFLVTRHSFSSSQLGSGQWTHSSPFAGNGRGWTRKSVETENIFCRRNIIWSLNANDLKLAANCLDLNSVGGSLLQVD